MSKYKISVITPFHNVPQALFKKTWNSMREQTFGFKNIEWIIVMHNCTKAEISFVKKLAKNHSNVKVHTLNNNSHTPSSPKNYAMKLATGKYIGFLDADDTYLKNCLEVAIREAEAEQVQVCMFRMEYHLEHPKVRPIDERTLWNQAEDKIIIGKKNRDNYRLYADNFYFLTSKIFDRKFLLKNKIDFDETLPIAEDYYFAVQCFLKANKMVYLPKHIGYHYYIHESSISQSGEFNDKDFLEYAKGILKCIELPEKHGIHTDAVNGFCMVVALRILMCPNLSLETRMKTKELFAPYIKNRITQKENKLYAIDRLSSRYWIARIILMNPKNPWKAYNDEFVLNAAVNLTAILGLNKNTDYGQKYNFSSVNNIKKYQQLPLMTRSALDGFIRLQTNIGESDILINGKPIAYLSDKSGNLFMNTNAQMQLYNEHFKNVFEGQTTFLVAKYNNKNGQLTNDKCAITNLFDAMLKNYFFNYRDQIKTNAKFSSADTSYFSNLSKKEHYIKIAKDALGNKNITRIFAFDIKDLLYMFKIIEGIKPSALKDIKNTWPKLKIVIGTNFTNNASDYKKLKKYIGNVEFSNGLYLTEPGILGAATSEAGIYEKITDGNFYELMDASGKVFKLSQAKPGNTYTLIVTNNAGLYRFVSNYKFEIVSNQNGKLTYKILPSK